MNIINKQFNQKSIFSNKNFSLIFIGKLFSQFGDVMFNLAIAWFILSLTSSATKMAIYVALIKGIYILMSPIGGTISDLIDRKKLIIYMDIIRGIVSILIGILMYFNITSIVLFYVSSIILSICGAVFGPASNAIIPSIVKKEQLTQAVSIGVAIQSFANSVGMVCGGIIYSFIGIKGIAILNAFSFFLCAILESFIILPKNNGKAKNILLLNKSIIKTIIIDTKTGYIFLKKKRSLFILMLLVALINLVNTPFISVFIPYIFNQILKTSTQNYSYVRASIAIGFIIGAIFIYLLPESNKVSKKLSTSLLTLSLIIILLLINIEIYTSNFIRFSTCLIFFIIIFLFIGILNALVSIPVKVIFQKNIPNEILGRITALLNTLTMFTDPIGTLLGGIATDTISMNLLLIFTSLSLFMLSIYIILQKDIRKI